MRERRPELTVIFAAIDRVLRVDLDANFARTASIVRATPPGAGLSEGITIALAGDARPAPRTWVLSESAWSQTVELPELSVAGLAEPDLERALAYELEPVSGVPAAFARVGARRVAGSTPGRARFWVVLLHANELASVATQLAARGSTLQGVAHPAGLTGSGARVEVWDQATLCTDGAGDWLVIGAGAGQRSWMQGIAEWLGRATFERIGWSGRARATLLAPDLARLPIADAGEGAFAREGEDWIVEAARTLKSRERSAPAVAAPVRPARSLSPRVLALVLGLAALVFVILRQQLDLERAQDLEARAEEAQSLFSGEQSSTRTRAELATKVGAAQTEVDATRTRVEAIESEWKALCERPRALVDAIQRTQSSALTLLGVRTLDEGALTIEGVGLDAALAQGFASDLELELAPTGLQVLPANTQDKRTASAAPYVAFTIEVRPKASALPAPVAQSAPRRAR